MTVYQDLHCDVDTSRDQVAEHAFVNGIDFLEVVTEPANDNQRVLWLSFIPKQNPAHTANLEALLDAVVLAHQQPDAKLLTIEGGVRVKRIAITELLRVGRRLRIRVDQPGDFSDYTLTVHLVYVPGDDPSQPPAKLHPAYASVAFNFKAGCPSHFDCRGDQCNPGPAPATPLVNIDYLARDYASFRQSLLDLIPSLHPDWIERNPADLGIALIELMAYAADHLSYYQDAVANEAFLETARQRISVRRHARLIDYAMHDGASARVFLFVETEAAGIIRDGTQILTRVTGPIAGKEAPHPWVITDAYAKLDAAADAAQAVFEIFGGFERKWRLDPALNALPLYRWGRTNCCLPRGTTRADVRGAVDALLHAGDFVLFEETSVDADPEHRQVVRLTAVQKIFDPLAPNTALTRLTWGEEDALRFPLCVNGQDAPLGIARGNLLLADHGRTVRNEWHPSKPGESEGIAPRPDRAYRFFLEHGPLSFRIDAGRTASVASLLTTDPHATVPQIAVALESDGDVTDWAAQPDLLSSFSTSPHFAVETDNDGRAMIRFGDGTAGMAPPKGVFVRSTYRIGAGTSGNVGSGALAHIVQPPPPPDPEPGEAFPAILSLRNPMPSWGGVAPETLDEVRLTAPATLRTRSDRAVVEEDYARAAMQNPRVSKAVATFRWTGTWHTVFVTVDPKGRVELLPDLEKSIGETLLRVVQTGYDFEINSADYVPVELEVEVCVKQGHFRTDVEADVLEALSSREGGFFHPDRFTFGQPLYLSQIYAAVMKVEGVTAAEVTALHRYGDGPAGELARGALAVGRTQVIRLDNDPNFPDNGVLRVRMGSGK
ncbi:MAG TPA: putative baseplate assembly protein [Thermoanaerobaculia bacterium]